MAEPPQCEGGYIWASYPLHFAYPSSFGSKSPSKISSSFSRNNLPKQFCERCFEQGDRKWQQDELELVLELDIRVCGRKMKCMGAGISVGGPPWAHEAGGAPSTLVDRWLTPQLCSQCQIFSNILEKIIFKFQGIWRTFIFKVFFIARIIQKTDRKILFYFISTK